MTDFVLMPEEATPEMEQAAEKYWNDRKFKALSDDPRTWKGLYAAMRAVAPAVQGEAVYLYRRRGFRSFEICNHVQYAELSEKPRLFETRVLYTAPQPSLDVPKLVEALELAQGFLRNKGHSEEDPFLLGAINAALAACRKQGGDQ